MFGAYYWAWPYWADSPNVVIVPPPSPVVPTRPTIVVPCRTKVCAGQVSDFGVYNLQDAVPVSEEVLAACAVKTCPTDAGDLELYNLQDAVTVSDEILAACAVKECPDAPDDLTIYNLQDALYFNGTPISVISQCPTGYFCPPGSFPRVFTYPPGTFVVLIPPTNTGFPIVITIAGCESTLNTILPAGSSQAQAQAAANVLISQAAAQQARCDAITISGPPLPRVISLTDIEQYACVDVPFSASIFASATPSSAPYTLFVAPQPAWMVTTQNATTLFLDGTPTTIGAVNFTVIATGTNASGTKSYTLNVIGIANASPLPDANDGTAYSEVLDGSSLGAILTWSVIAGALPTWMNLNNVTGALFGTPGPGDVGIIDNFTMQVTNGVQTCTKEFDIETKASLLTPCELIFTPMTWGAPTVSTVGVGAANGVGVSNLLTVTSSAGDGGAGLHQGFLSAITGTVLYTGPAITCCALLTVDRSVDPNAIFDIEIRHNGGLIKGLSTVDPSGSYSFNIPISVGATITVFAQAQCTVIFSGAIIHCNFTLLVGKC